MNKKISVKCIVLIILIISVLIFVFNLLFTNNDTLSSDEPLTLEQFVASYYDAMINKNVDEFVSKIYLYDKASMYEFDKESINNSQYESYEINSIEELDSNFYVVKHILIFNNEMRSEIENLILTAEIEEDREMLIDRYKALTEGNIFVLLNNNEMYIVRNYATLPQEYKNIILNNDEYSYLINEPEILLDNIMN